MNMKRIWSWGLFVLLIFAGSLVSAQEATPDTVTPPPPQVSAEIEVGEIELMEITIEAVIEKPRVAILPKRVEPELGEMEFIDRSFEEELKKGPKSPFLLKGEARKPFKIQQLKLKTISEVKD
ncbi:MAG: hypothetical protein V2J62_02880 [candidate division KSB1 bacterium]|jgi:hypothetical protein|nr:hypothetical protein [candidate division KSB1 bacterium]